MSLLLCKVLSAAAAGLVASACPKQSCASAIEQANAATFARCKTLMRFFLHGSDSNVVTHPLVVTQTFVTRNCVKPQANSGFYNVYYVSRCPLVRVTIPAGAHA